MSQVDLDFCLDWHAGESLQGDHAYEVFDMLVQATIERWRATRVTVSFPPLRNGLPLYMYELLDEHEHLIEGLPVGGTLGSGSVVCVLSACAKMIDEMIQATVRDVDAGGEVMNPAEYLDGRSHETGGAMALFPDGCGWSKPEFYNYALGYSGGFRRYTTPPEHGGSMMNGLPQHGDVIGFWLIEDIVSCLRAICWSQRTAILASAEPSDWEEGPLPPSVTTIWGNGSSTSGDWLDRVDAARADAVADYPNGEVWGGLRRASKSVALAQRSPSAALPTQRLVRSSCQVGMRWWGLCIHSHCSWLPGHTGGGWGVATKSVETHR